MASTEKSHSTNNSLHTAASCGETEEVKRILKAKKCSVNIENDKRQTPLHLACLNGHLDIVDVLVNDFNANIGAIDREGNTPLSLAAGGGHVQIVLLLILISIFGRKYGSQDRMPVCQNVCKIDQHKNFFEKLVFDSYHDCKPLETILNLKFNDLLTLDENRKSIFSFLSACLGISNAIKMFARSNLFVEGFFGMSLLHCACFGGHFLLVRSLISDYHLDIFSVDKRGSSILHYAALGGNIEIVLLLITTFGLDISAVNDFNETPLCLAVLNGHRNIIITSPDQ